ncbi:MAG: aminodeoxychorismate/anthranilate synthase component II [Bacteroidales bacterium]
MQIRKVLIVDNNDSFVYNLVEMLRGKIEADVVCESDLYDGIERGYHGILLSPGGGVPSEYPHMMDLIGRCWNSHVLLGVCLGHQAIAAYAGGEVRQLEAPLHGFKSRLSILIPDDSLLHGISEQYGADCFIGRYHSWVVEAASVESSFYITGVDESHNVMAMSHKSHPIFGVQFHPESIISNCGERLISNFISRINSSQ